MADHKVYFIEGDPEPHCGECFGSEYPYKCELCKSGYIHEDFIDSSYDSIYVRTFCDNEDCEYEH